MQLLERRTIGFASASPVATCRCTKSLASQNDFVAYVDAVGDLDGSRCLLEWKTTASRYQEEPAGLLALDPQLVCYSWVTVIADVGPVRAPSAVPMLQRFGSSLAIPRLDPLSYPFSPDPARIAHGTRRLFRRDLPWASLRFGNASSEVSSLGAAAIECAYRRPIWS